MLIGGGKMRVFGGQGDAHEEEEGKQIPAFELPAVCALAAAGDEEDAGDC